MIAWREKVRAFALHFLITLALSACAAALVFLIWFPAPFATMLGGTKLFGILLMCDLGLGPLTSFIIYNSRKSRRALLFDYTVVGIVQLGAFLYGLHAVANTRPVFIAFVKDRLDVISADEIDDADLAQGAAGYRERPRWRPQLVGTQAPQDKDERAKVLFSAMEGKDYSMLPAYYVSYEQNLPEIKARALPVSELERRHSAAKPLLAQAQTQLRVPIEKLVWVPVKHRRGFWTALLDAETGRPVYWLPLDPY
ncbi:MAG TPA: TfpX/TfpZ family type IV pilin accessory protein [Steroidobacteraceae bacterium]|nr:TfpX/TfpZ family type IV pilin accessory protein [Steroidobacteraceae bacterium]